MAYDVDMASVEHHITFGPVPSRRLGQSLGINNIPAKVCSYACVYCQIGPTTEKTITPRAFFSPQEIYAAVATHLAKIRTSDARVDYLSFVPDGEPTLDSRLGESIKVLRDLGLPIAVITNATLLSREDVRLRLREADLVSVKVDCVEEEGWRRINHPHRDLQLEPILQGIRDFASSFGGRLITDTMLIAGINDSHHALTATADFLAEISPQTAYLAVPTRPTTVRALQGTDEAGLIRAHEIFSARLENVELLTGHDSGTFAHTGNARDDVLAITAVHPMREADVRHLLAEDHAHWELIETLLAEGSIKAVEHAGERFYLRTLRFDKHSAQAGAGLQ